MEYSDRPEYHQIQHYKTGDHVTVRDMSLMQIADQRRSNLPGCYPLYYSPSSGRTVLAFNDEMGRMTGGRYVIHQVEKHHLGYTYHLRDLADGYLSHFNFSAYMLRPLHKVIKTNHQAAAFLSPEKEANL